MRVINKGARFGLFVLTVLVAVGCSRQEGAAGDSVEPESSPPSARETRPAEIASPRREASADQGSGLPHGVTLTFRHEIRTEKVLRREGREDVRRVDIEYLEGDQFSAYDQTAQALTSAGFSLRNRNTMENGYIRASFRKPGYGNVVVIVTQSMGEMKARNDAAIGRVVFDLPPPKA